MKKYCLFGECVQNSKSALIHNSIFKKHLIDGDYSLINVDSQSFVCAVDNAKKECAGFNVTMPYKADIIKLLDEASKEVEFLGACNTVKVENGKLFGFNTDGMGFMQALKDLNFDVKGKKVLILGSGGATAPILYEVEKSGAIVSISNRTKDNAKSLLEKLNSNAKMIDNELVFAENKSLEFDAIINTTALGGDKYPYKMPLNEKCLKAFPSVAIDIVYHPKQTPFLKIMKENGVKTQNGLKMLFYQAFFADCIWLGELDFEKAKQVLREIEKNESFGD